jgi:hypothetical protein
MQKLLLISVIISSIVIPIRASRTNNAKQGLKRALLQMLLFDFFYLLLVMYVWSRLA